MKQHYQDVKIIVITALPLERFAEGAGIDRVLTKPFGLAAIKKVRGESAGW